MIKTVLTIIAFLCLTVSASGQIESADLNKQLSTILREQQTAWNKGDIPAFMEHYWQSDSLKFIGKEGIVYGWDATLSRYLKSYPGPEAMGALNFEVIDLMPLGADHAQMVGKFFLKADRGDSQGIFTLLWSKLPNGRWVIISDHTSG